MLLLLFFRQPFLRVEVVTNWWTSELFKVLLIVHCSVYSLAFYILATHSAVVVYIVVYWLFMQFPD